jgi:hypothetical protein
MCFNHYVDTKILKDKQITDEDIDKFISEYKPEENNYELANIIFSILFSGFDKNKLIKLTNTSIIENLFKKSIENNSVNPFICFSGLILRHITTFLCCPETTTEECKDLLDIIYNMKIIGYYRIAYWQTAYFYEREYFDEMKETLKDRTSREYFDYYFFVHVIYLHNLSRTNFVDKSIFNLPWIKKLLENTKSAHYPDNTENEKKALESHKEA